MAETPVLERDETATEADGAGAATSGGAETKQKAPKTLAGVYIQTPPELREKLEEAGKGAGVTPQVWARDFLASHFGVVLPPVQRKIKYANDDERKKAQTAKRMERQELIKSLLKAHKEKLAAAAQSNGQVENAA